MAGYTRRNLRTDVDDQAVAFGLAPSLEFRAARDALETTESALSFIGSPRASGCRSGTITCARRRSTCS